MKATTYYKGFTVEIEGTPEEIAQYTEALSKQLSQPPDSTARATMIWQPPMWYQYIPDNAWNQYIPDNCGAAGGHPHILIYDTCTPWWDNSLYPSIKWFSPLYPTLGGSLL